MPRGQMTCKGCGKEKTLGAFRKIGRGRMRLCKECESKPKAPTEEEVQTRNGKRTG